MAKLKLGPILNEHPVRIAVELAATIHRDLLAYAGVLKQETGQDVEAVQLVGPMLARFMATDRGFARAQRVSPTTNATIENAGPDLAQGLELS